MPVSNKPSPKPRPKQARAGAAAAEPKSKQTKSDRAKAELNQASTGAIAAAAATVKDPATELGSKEKKSEPKPTPNPTPIAAPARPQVEATAAIVATAQEEVEMNLELPKQASQIASKSVDQAQAAFDKASDLAHSNVQIFDAAAGAFKANATELQLKAMEIAQANSNAVFGLLRRILAARQASELFEAQRSFVSEQFLTSVRHMNELNLITLRLASETAKPLQQGVLKSFDELKKAASA